MTPIYLTMTIGVLVIELTHVNAKKYPSIKDWIKARWDNLAVSMLSGIGLCMAFPDLSNIELVKNVVDIHDYPSLGGIVIGLSTTPIINFIKSKTKSKLTGK